MSESPKSEAGYPPSFYSLLDAIRDKPAMWIGRKSLAILRPWLDGYDCARRQAGIDRTDEEREFAGFDEFVCCRYDWLDVGGWAAKIAYHHRDDADAFGEFFKLLDEFRSSRLKPGKRGKPRKRG